jgi:hypothetical protein
VVDVGGRAPTSTKSGPYEIRPPARCPPSSVMNSRRFNWSNCIRSPASQGQIAGYRIGEDKSGGNGDQSKQRSSEVMTLTEERGSGRRGDLPGQGL